MICAAPARVERFLLNAACAQSLPTEIICDDKWPEAEGAQEDKTTQAWNLSVRLLYMAGLTPWRLADAAGDSCFVGVSFYREPENCSSDAWTSFAHVVTELGQGYVLQGDAFEWNPNEETLDTPHLDKEQAAKLMSRVLKTCGKTVGRSPRKVVIQKTTPYSEGERLGFEDSLRGTEQHALVSVSRSGTFFLRPGRKPIFRGTAIPFEKNSAWFMPRDIRHFCGATREPRSPNLLRLRKNWGSLTFREVATDLLRLTKLNWSTSAFSADFPVTLAPGNHAARIFKILGQQDLVLDDRYYL